jgi:HEAT repeat protein
MYAAWALGLSGKAAKSAVPALRAALQDADADVRRKAAWALAHVAPGDGESLAPLLQACRDRDAEAAEAAIDAVAKYGKTVLPTLAVMVKARETFAVAGAVLVRIAEEDEGKAGDEAANLFVAAASERAVHGLDAWNAFLALSVDHRLEQIHLREAYTRLGGRALPGLARAAAHPDPLVRKHAAHALCHVRECFWFSKHGLDAEAVHTVLLRLVGDSDPLVVAAACKELEFARLEKRERAALEKLLLADSLSVARAALLRLEDQGPDGRDPSWEDALQERLPVAKGAEQIKLACLLNGEQALAVVRAALKHPDASLRHRAALALALPKLHRRDQRVQIDPKEGRTVLAPILLESLKHAQPWRRAEAAEGLSHLLSCSAEALPALLAAMKDDDPRVRQTAARWLLQFKKEDTKKVVAALLSLADDPHVDVRLALYDPLRAMGATALPVLARLLEDKHAQVREIALELLNVDAPTDEPWKLTPALVKAALKQPAGLGYLRWFPAKRVDFPKLLELLLEHDAAARQALQHAGDAGADPAKVVGGLLRDLSDADPKVARRAARALEQVYLFLPREDGEKILTEQGAEKPLAAALARYTQLLKTGKPEQRIQAAAVLVQFQALLRELNLGDDRPFLGIEKLQKSLNATIEAAVTDADFRVRREVRHAR